MLQGLANATGKMSYQISDFVSVQMSPILLGAAGSGLHVT